MTVEVINDTDTPELVHWHGMLIPPDVDGTEEEGSPLVPPHGRRRFQLTPGPAGSRWYHSHAMAMDDLHKGAYTGQFGFVYVDGGNDPGHYDQELFLGAARLGAVLYRHHGRRGRRHARRAAAGETGDDEHRSGRPRSGFDDLLDQRQGAGVGRANPRARGAAGADSHSERQRHREPAHRSGRPQDEGDRAGWQSGADAADARFGLSGRGGAHGRCGGDEPAGRVDSGRRRRRRSASRAWA